MPLKQDNRAIAIKTALGPDVLALRSFSLQEQISRLFQIEADLLSEQGELDLDKVVGHDVTIRLNNSQKDKRFFHGFVSRLVQAADQGGHAHYRATIVPWLWFLTRTADCCIFQKMTVPDILEDVFKFYGFNDYKLNLSTTYTKREFCVQYRETDFNFVSRLMEQEGIYYYFEHEDGKHTLVIADSISAHNPFPGYAEVSFEGLQPGHTAAREVVSEWVLEKEAQPVACALTDFDFKKPKTPLNASASVTRKYGEAKFEVFDFPGEYLEHSEGERLAGVRLDELQSQYEVLHGKSGVRGFAAGSTFKLKKHPRSDQNREYLVTGISLHADAGPFDAAGHPGEGEAFACSLTAIDKSQQFRPARTTPKPFVQGPQTAIVVGPAGDEIYTDDEARVKVHFHWDRHDHSDENSSCWLRVSQPWAGKGWGSMSTPRIGQEVIVEFLEGDPDEPIITGRVYNADQAAPYAGGKGVVSGLKSKTHKGGGYNEMSMDDTAGKEKITIHGQYDMNTTVEHDQTTTVHNNRTDKIDVDDSETVGGNQTIKVTKDQKTNVSGNQATTVIKNQSYDVTGDQSTNIAGSRTETVAKNESLSVSITRNHSVGVNESINIGAAQEINVGAAQTVSVGAIQTISVGKNQTVSVGGKRTTDVAKEDVLKVGKKLSIEVEEEIDIKTGDAKITMKKDGSITIEGKDITLKGSGNIAVKASSDVTIKGSKVAAN